MTVLIEKPHSTFIHIPKTAGVSVSNWLVKHISNARQLGHKSIYMGKHADMDFLQKTHGDLGTTFVIVRNPWDRMVSGYHYIRRTTDIKIDFASFIKKRWAKGYGCVRKEQYKFINDNIDHILRLENLDKDFKIIQDFYNIHEPLGSPQNTSVHSHYTDYYTQELIDIVAHEYKKDVELFNYDYK